MDPGPFMRQFLTSRSTHISTIRMTQKGFTILLLWNMVLGECCVLLVGADLSDIQDGVGVV